MSFNEIITGAVCTNLIIVSGGGSFLREILSAGCIQQVFFIRVETHGRVIRNKGNRGGIALCVTVKLLNYLPKGDLE